MTRRAASNWGAPWTGIVVLLAVLLIGFAYGFGVGRATAPVPSLPVPILIIPGLEAWLVEPTPTPFDRYEGIEPAFTDTAGTNYYSTTNISPSLGIISRPAAWCFESTKDGCVGKLWHGDGRWRFEGKADESAKVFWEYLAGYMNRPLCIEPTPPACPATRYTVCLEVEHVVEAIRCGPTQVVKWRDSDDGRTAWCAEKEEGVSR